MEAQRKSKLAQWIKKVAVELVVIIFVIGFFSQSLLNYTLPRVSSVPVISGQVVKTYHINGGIEYRDQLQVRLGSPVIVDEYFLEPGRRVQEGQPVFRINQGYRTKSFEQQVAEMTSELEKERLALQKFAATTEGDEKRIQLLAIDLYQAEQKLNNGRALFESGAVSEMELKDQEAEVERLRLQYEIEQIKVEEGILNRQINVKERLLAVAALEEELTQMSRRKHFYSHIDQEGVYYAAVDGLITTAAPSGHILAQDDSVITIASVNEEMEGLIYRGALSEMDGKHFDFGDLLDVNLEGVAEAIRIKITNLYYDADEDIYKMEGQLMRDIPRQVTIRKQYQGDVVRREQATMVVPRSALRGVEIRPGEKGSVFLVETEEGILGDHHLVRETEVTIMSVGDQYISIMGLEGVDRPRVVTPVSHRVRDGVKVLHGY